nr:retrovirus-related Pol polyprotein from transposon TNT 1-94 [Tanacetum cinerariifolium]
MWYNRLSEYLLKEGYKNNYVCPCIFIKRFESKYVIIAVYVDDLNIIGTPGELPKAIDCLKIEFEMKDLGKTKFCLGLQIEHLKDGILVHQETYIEKLLKRFYMDKSHSLSTLMVVRTLDVKKDPFRPRDVDEEILGPEVPYLSVIEALMFLAGHTRPAIVFSFNLFATYSSCPTRRHWNGVKQIFRYLQYLKLGMYLQVEELQFHSGRSCGISSETKAPTVLYEDNATCIAQLKEGYIKGDRTKHILPKFFFTHDLQKNGDIIVQQVRSSDNLADLFIKVLPTSTFRKLSHNIGMRRLKDLKLLSSEGDNTRCTLFPLVMVLSHWVFLTRNAGYEHQRLGNVAGARETVEDMNYDSEQSNQNDEDVDLAKERELLASLIGKLKCEID